jgi:spore photoproduct lyase
MRRRMTLSWGSIRAITERFNEDDHLQTDMVLRAGTLSEAREYLREENLDRVIVRKKGISQGFAIVRDVGFDGKTREFLDQVGDGSIIKRFSKTKPPRKPDDVVCPHFLELKWAYGCPYDCSWCYLKGTLRFQKTKTRPVAKDAEKVSKHVSAFLKGWRKPETLNTGELADSLMFEHNGFALSENVLPLFRNQTRHKVLVVTKSTNVSNFLTQDFTDFVKMAFSINCDTVAKRWEKAPSPASRIDAAGRVSDAGYTTMVRIDPMVPVPKWINNYSNLIDRIFERFTPHNITFGTLRGLSTTLRNTTDTSWQRYLCEKSSWGKKISTKKRYEMYSAMARYLHKEYDYHSMAFCKETLEMWEKLGLDFKEIQCVCIN